MRTLKYLTIAPAILFLAACFMSDEPLLPEGEGILLAQTPVEFCDAEDSCEPATIEGDTYVIQPPPDADDEAPAYLRFGYLTGEGRDAVYLAEARLTDEDGESEWYYLVARALPDAADGTRRYQVVLPSCTKATDEQMVAYGIEKRDSYTCSIGSWQDLSAFLLETQAENFSDPEWWDAEF